MSDESWPEYLFSYTFDGKKWCFSIAAKDEFEALERLRAIGDGARLDGSLIKRINL